MLTDQKLCAKCGGVGGLSKDFGTGEIECILTGCGHGHGFTEVNKTVPIGDLIEAPAEVQK